MREEGTVSLWTGRAPSEAALRAAVEVSSSEDGEFLGCDFSRAFAIRHFDEDYIEAEYLETSSTDLREILRGVSYGDVIIDRFLAIGQVERPANCLILLYNFHYAGNLRNASLGPLVMSFFGAVNYL